MSFPESAILLDPGGRRLHGLGCEAATVNAAIDFAAKQAGRFEDAEVLRDGGKGHGERRGKALNGGFTLREAGQNGAAGGISERGEGGVEVFHNG